MFGPKSICRPLPITYRSRAKSSNRGQKSARLSKLDAYGHGAVPVATAALAARRQLSGGVHDTGSLGVREAGIMALSSFGTMRDMKGPLWTNNITQTVYDLAVAQELSAAALQENKVAKVHLAVDTG